MRPRLLRAIRFVGWFGGMTLMGVAVALALALAMGRVGGGRARLSPPLDMVAQAISAETGHRVVLTPRFRALAREVTRRLDHERRRAGPDRRGGVRSGRRHRELVWAAHRAVLVERKIKRRHRPLQYFRLFWPDLRRYGGELLDEQPFHDLFLVAGSVGDARLCSIRVFRERVFWPGQRSAISLCGLALMRDHIDRYIAAVGTGVLSRSRHNHALLHHALLRTEIPY